MDTKIKGDIISGKLGRNIMLKAVNTYTENSKIIDSDTLTNIINDTEFTVKLRKKCTFIEAQYIELPLVDLNTVNDTTPSITNDSSETVIEKFNSTSSNHIEESNTDSSNNKIGKKAHFKINDYESSKFKNLQRDRNIQDAVRRMRRSQ